jgi:octaprenyl-diphosphate synthase
MLPTSAPPAVGQQLQAELSEVQARFAAELTSDLPCVNELVDYLERYRGKMLRPMLVLASGLACSEHRRLTEAHRVVGTVVEMVHMATLVHDDVLDEADTRRRGGTINRRHGNETAVMLGDYLISHAYHLCSSLPDASISRRIARITNTVCEGELLQLANRGNLMLDEPTYFEIIRRKTASLCGVCCEMGGFLASAVPSVCRGLYHFGQSIGTSFQIIDDLLDLTGDEQTVGKTLGRDLDKGKLTLPLIHCRDHLPAPQRRELLGWLEHRSQDQESAEGQAGPTQAPALAAMLQQTDSLRYAHQQATQRIDQALGLLEPMVQEEARDFLRWLAQAVLSRQA